MKNSITAAAFVTASKTRALTIKPLPMPGT